MSQWALHSWCTGRNSITLLFLCLVVCVIGGQGDSDGAAADSQAHIQDGGLPNAVPSDETSPPISLRRSNATTSREAASAIPRYECQSNVKKMLFRRDGDYDVDSVPIPLNQVALDVNVSLTFWHVSEINTVKGTAEVFFTFWLTWEDERLTWDPSDPTLGGCDYIDVRASADLEQTQMWVPNFDLINRKSGLQHISDELATVWHNGTVHWIRQGGVSALCALTGLERFPYSDIGCYFEFGSTYFRGVDYRLWYGDPSTPGLLYGNFPAKFQEYALMSEASETVKVREERIRYHFYFHHASRFYENNVIIPSVIFTFLSFGMFLLDLRVGERLSYGVSLMLITVSQSILTKDSIPTSQERKWIDFFVAASWAWMVLAVAETVLIARIYFREPTRKEKEEDAADEEEETKSSINEQVVDLEEAVELADGKHKMRSSISSVRSRFSNAPRIRIKEEVEDRLSVHTFSQALFISKPPNEAWKKRIIRRMDAICSVVFPLSYLIFITVMFLTKDNW